MREDTIDVDAGLKRFEASMEKGIREKNVRALPGGVLSVQADFSEAVDSLLKEPASDVHLQSRSE